MIEVYCFGRRPSADDVVGLTRDLRILWAVEELELSYRPVPIDLASLSAMEASILGPFRQLPVIVDEGQVVRESGAILLYLAEKSGRVSSLLERSHLTQWVFTVLTTLEPRIGAVWNQRSQKPRDQRAVETAHRRLNQLEQFLATSTYLLDQFSVADILLSTVLAVAKRVDLTHSYPSLTAYLAACEDRPARRKSLEEYESRVGLRA